MLKLGFPLGWWAHQKAGNASSSTCSKELDLCNPSPCPTPWTRATPWHNCEAGRVYLGSPTSAHPSIWFFVPPNLPDFLLLPLTLLAATFLIN